MNKSTKAALLSALVFPGVGHFFLKRKMMGSFLTSASAFVVYYIMSKIFDMTEKLTAQIQSGQLQPDIAAITEVVSAELASPDNQFNGLATMLLMLFWFVGIVDSYRIGYALEKA